MDVKEKMVELLREAPYNVFDNKLGGMLFDSCLALIADYLIANGVTVQDLDGCKYCEEHEDLPEHFIDGKPVGKVFDTCIQPNENGLWHLEVPCGADIGIRFCPMCGRRLPQPQKGE